MRVALWFAGIGLFLAHWPRSTKHSAVLLPKPLSDSSVRRASEDRTKLST